MFVLHCHVCIVCFYSGESERYFSLACAVMYFSRCGADG
ncbi:Predicted protein [Anoxybacillus flavithermus WK1]|uniref:Uncharacterized protein n=1 Tax=Anoxybacillus flavithermus (strain DSM 21510 / WK1) TaxID=491915 RepID=B7GKB5_ANOFW|nr:Predicted protein [Anoxybacillus flavithermus WK1]